MTVYTPKRATCIFPDCEHGYEQAATPAIATCELCQARRRAEAKAARGGPRVRLTVVTASELNSWRACGYRWGLRYVDGLVSKEGAKPLRAGTSIHAGLAALYGAIARSPGVASDAFVEGAVEAARLAIGAAHDESAKGLEYDDAIEESVEMRDLGAWVAKHYAERFREDFAFIVPLGIETPFEFPLRDVRGAITPHLRYAGVIDLLAYDRRTGDVVVADHKSTAGAIDSLDKKIELDPQLCGYVWAAREMARAGALVVDGVKLGPEAVSGRVFYNVIRKAIPRAPKVNKNGMVSTAAIDTLPQLYADALAEQAADRKLPITDEQMELLQRLKSKGETYIARREFWLSDADIERWRREFFVEAGRIRQAESDPAFRTRNPLACTMASSPVCVYRHVCLEPHVSEYRAAFEVRPKHEEVLRARGESET